MDVEIDHQDPPDEAFGLKQSRRDRHVVEHAETGAAVMGGVVAAPGRVAGRAVLQRQPGGERRAGDRAA